ncbi:endonuclease/exonuclease/phosphatase family protein [Aliiglaciecola sp. LCG003]|uniref:endonuclease/exonuclease/phosphatase family protein n=1 Tax=Aliiglaciecola sp. LCG003 TaxID=3053655 RepID=UPI002573893C|nr:endonuclease/exonuclease/phosphatase family protein [Aliiglaciecola sp. LCG003]WJG10706.1 endonuclease/exonuclease/phosphatase family protein [Aliiglaciecola sp. LCG003]
MENWHIYTTGLLLLITALPLAPTDHWIARVWEFPRVQISGLLLINTLAVIVFVDSNTISMWVCLGISGCCLVYHLIWILPYTALWRKQVQSSAANPDEHISIITANVLMSNKDTGKLIDLVIQLEPDILVTLETNSWWQDKLSILHERYPYRVASPLDNLYGMHLYSKRILNDVELKERVEQGVPSITCSIVINDSKHIKAYFLHPAPPSPTENESAEQRDHELMQVANEIRTQSGPIIVTGDLNDVAWSPSTREFRKTSGLLDPRIGRGIFNTFHADYRFCRWPLDHIFHSDEFELTQIKRLPNIGSDHFPLYSKLSLK